MVIREVLRAFFVFMLLISLINLASATEHDISCFDTDKGINEFTPGIGYRLWPPSLEDAENEVDAPDSHGVSEIVGSRDECLDGNEKIILELYCEYTRDPNELPTIGKLGMVVKDCPEGYICRDNLPVNNPYLQLQLKLWRHYLKGMEDLNETEKESLFRKIEYRHSHAAACVKEGTPEISPTEIAESIDIPGRQPSVIATILARNDNKFYSLGYGTPTNTQAVPEFSLSVMLTLIAIVLAVLGFRRMRNS